MLHEQYMYTVYTPFILCSAFLLDDVRIALLHRCRKHPASVQKKKIKYVYVFMSLLLITSIGHNMNSWSDRYTRSQDDALRSAIEYMHHDIPEHAVIYTEQNIISVSTHDCVDIWTYRDMDYISSMNISYIIISDFWVKLIESDPGFNEYINDNFDLIESFEGYSSKQRMYIYKKKEGGI